MTSSVRDVHVQQYPGRGGVGIPYKRGTSDTPKRGTNGDDEKSYQEHLKEQTDSPWFAIDFPNDNRPGLIHTHLHVGAEAAA